MYLWFRINGPVSFALITNYLQSWLVSHSDQEPPLWIRKCAVATSSQWWWRTWPARPTLSLTPAWWQWRWRETLGPPRTRWDCRRTSRVRIPSPSPRWAWCYSGTASSEHMTITLTYGNDTNWTRVLGRLIRHHVASCSSQDEKNCDCSAIVIMSK